MRPLGDRVIVRQQAIQEKTESGLFIPEAGQEKPLKGTVLAVGPGKVTDKGTRIPVSVVPGDTVLFGKYAGSYAKFGDENLLIISEESILAVVNEC